jgi:hypothetical protein
VAAASLDLVVQQGYVRTVVPLRASGILEGRAWHFTGESTHLKGARHFDAALAVPLAGGTRTGIFDPWVTPAVIGVPPNELARFVCPMHEGMRAREAGPCKLCGMPLVHLLRGPRTDLHDPKYAMSLAREGDQLRFTPRRTDTGETVRDLLVVHEHLLHLIIVGADLAFFDHVHPARQPDGSFLIEYAFPGDGEYLLFADITPQGEPAQVFRLAVSEGHSARGVPPSLSLPAALAREFGRYHVELVLQPRRLVAEREAQLIFRLSMNGKAVTDLEPYIGAMGHCVVISEDTRAYLHSHPEQLEAAPSPRERGGPQVSFHTTFPRAGRYKAWGQFKRGDEIIVADFVVDVAAPILPRALVDLLIFD